MILSVNKIMKEMNKISILQIAMPFTYPSLLLHDKLPFVDNMEVLVEQTSLSHYTIHS